MATQKDIATRLGVSVSLVSRALGGTAEAIGVSPETIARIQKAAADMGYQPNLSARILKGAPARTFGVVVYDFADPFFGPLIGELQRLAHEQTFSLVLGGFEGRKAWELDITALLKHHIDGLIIIGSGRDLKWAKPFTHKGLPMVRIGSGPSIEGLHTVRIDEQVGMTLIAEHLHDLGHRRIGFVGADHPQHHERLKHLQKAWSAHNATLRKQDIAFSSSALSDAGYDAARQGTARIGANGITALVAASDLIALGAIRALAEANIHVPHDLSITGYDDIPMAHLSVPSLTTIRQPIAQMARTAFKWIVNAQGVPTPQTATEIVIQPERIERESTKPQTS